METGPQANVDVVVGTFESVNERDFAAVMNASADDITLEIHEVFGTEVTIAGKEAVGRWFGDWFSQFAPDYRFEVEEARGAGDQVFLVATHHARGRASGAPVEQRIVYAYGLRDGRIRKIEAWPESGRSAALEAAGLAE